MSPNAWFVLVAVAVVLLVVIFSRKLDTESPNRCPACGAHTEWPHVDTDRAVAVAAAEYLDAVKVNANVVHKLAALTEAVEAWQGVRNGE